MRRALRLAERGWALVRPNPMVGAVVIANEEVIGEGWHERYGGPHAEVNALAQAGERARGATLYVTLEPCNHHGRTPPCTDAILNAGIARVVYSAADPNPAARGGAERLRAAGVEVIEGALVGETRSLNADFFYAFERKCSFVALKLAMSMDGRISSAQGTRSRVSGTESYDELHRLRAGFDAIMVGARTARVDDPLLTVRGELRAHVPPLRVVLDSTASLDPRSRLLQTIDEGPVWVVCAPDAPPERIAALRSAGAHVIPVARAGGGRTGVDLSAVLHALWEGGARAVLCEGGGQLGGALLTADMVQRLHLFIAPILLGGAGPPAFNDAPVMSRGEWSLVRQRRFGDDVALTYDRAN